MREAKPTGPVTAAIRAMQSSAGDPKVIRFDQYHPNFCDAEFVGVVPSVNLQVYFGGIYCGEVSTRSGLVQARGADWQPLGAFETSDDAIVAVMKSAVHVQQN